MDLNFYTGDIAHISRMRWVDGDGYPFVHQKIEQSLEIGSFSYLYHSFRSEFEISDFYGLYFAGFKLRSG